MPRYQFCVSGATWPRCGPCWGSSPRSSSWCWSSSSTRSARSLMMFLTMTNQLGQWKQIPPTTTKIKTYVREIQIDFIIARLRHSHHDHMNVTHERFSVLVIKSKVEEFNGRPEEMSTRGMPYKSGVRRKDSDSEHFLAWLCCFFFRISFIQVNFFHVGQKYKNNDCMQGNYCLIQAFILFVCVFMNDFCSSKPLTYRKYATMILVWQCLYRLSYYCIPFGKVAYDSVNQLRALRNVLPCLICTWIVHWCMKSLEISIVIWMFFILMHLSLQIFLQTMPDCFFMYA